jgi:hypothetical protein
MYKLTNPKISPLAVGLTNPRKLSSQKCAIPKTSALCIRDGSPQDHDENKV